MKAEIINLRDMSDTRELMESKPPHFFAIFMYLLIAMLVAALIWSYVGMRDVYVTAQGVIRPTGDISLIKNAINGKIETFSMKEGQDVSAGDVLYVVGSKGLQTSLEAQNELLTEVEEDIQKLTVYRQSIETNQNLFKVDQGDDIIYHTLVEKYLSDVQYLNKQIADDRTTLVKQKENALLTLETAEINTDTSEEELANLELYKQSLETKTNQLPPEEMDYFAKFTDYTVKLTALQQRHDNAADELATAKTLHDAGVLSDHELETAQQKLTAVDNETEQFKSNEMVAVNQSIEKARDAIKQNQMAMKQVQQTASNYDDERQSPKVLIQNKKLELLTGIDAQITASEKLEKELLQQIEELTLQKKDVVVTAPIDGTVSLTQTFVPGEYIQNGQEVATIIPPSPDKLKVDMLISNKDIASIKVDQVIKFKILALPYKEYGFVEGVVREIGVDARSVPNSSEKYYLVEAVIDNAPIENYKGEQSELKVGMVVEGQVITDTKRMLVWFLEAIDLKE